MDHIVETQSGSYLVSSDRSRIDISAVHAYLSTSYWSPGLPIEVLQRAIDGSLCFGVYLGAAQVGFARVVTDSATFAYLCDVFILEAHRGLGLSKRLMETVMKHPQLSGLRRFTLVTRDAHGLYEQFGFQPLAKPQAYMEIHKADIYLA